MQAALDLLSAVTRELAIFAASGLLLSGLDDLAIDIIWIARTAWRQLFVYRKHARASAADLPRAVEGRIAFFVPAWDESAIIARMAAATLARLKDDDFRLYVGIYPNDPASRDALAAIDDPRLRTAMNPLPGPTTKADCLNTLWRALTEDDAARGEQSVAVVLHDAEDRVHPDEAIVYRALLDRIDYVQLPVTPILHRRTSLVEGHYADEFAESHCRALVVREALGGGIPAAGVGCAFRRDVLERVAEARGGEPFDAGSLVEDYELGLRLAEIGARRAFVRVRAASGKGLVTVRAAFPDTVGSAVRQKSRWIAGIALAGWDRLGWHGGLAERWFRLHDRKALFSALVVLVAYVDTLLLGVLATAHLATGWSAQPPGPLLEALTKACAGMLVWRLAMRMLFTWRCYGFGQALLAIPRVVVSNAISIMAVRRAVGIYLRARRDGVVRWDKTANRFSEAAE